MTITSDKWLALGIIGLYLYDCLRLAPPDCFYVSYSRGRWGFAFPGRAFRIGRDALTLSNPLTPWRFEWRANLRSHSKAIDGSVIDQFVASVDKMFFGVISYALAIMIFLPTSFFLYGVGSISFLLLILVYLLLLNMVLQIWRLHKLFGLTGKQVISLVLECVLCPPFAVNAVRKIGMLKSEIPNSVEFAERFLAPDVLSRFRADALNYVHQQQQWYEPEDAAYKEWDSISNRLRGVSK